METTPLTQRRIFHTWWPLAASWLLMGIEGPAISAIIARLANPEISLASYGGIIFPLSLIIESPIIMLLAASTALSKDWNSFVKIRRFMMITSALMTGFHLAAAFTPLYYVIVEQLLGVPQEIVEPARVGLMIMIPWTWSIAYRRFHQGMLIRFGHSRAVTTGTVIRLSADLTVLAIGYLIHDISGVIVASSAVIAGVMSEAIYVGIISQPVIHKELKLIPPIQPVLTLRAFLAFYLPLVMTSLLTLLVQPIGSAAISRMPMAIESLATWSVVSGLVFMFRSFGIAYNEVVVALMDEFQAAKQLWKFAVSSMLTNSLIWLLILATPINRIWFADISALPDHLVRLAQTAIWLTLPLPVLSFLQSWYQGAILHSRKTRAITEAVVIYLLVIIITLIMGVIYGKETGLYIALASFVFSTFIQTVWLWYRSQTIIRSVRNRDETELSISPAEISS